MDGWIEGGRDKQMDAIFFPIRFLFFLSFNLLFYSLSFPFFHFLSQVLFHFLIFFLSYPCFILRIFFPSHFLLLSPLFLTLVMSFIPHQEAPPAKLQPGFLPAG